MNREDLVTTIEIKDRNGRVIESREVVRYAGLLSRAHEEGLKRIETKLVQLPTEENGMVAVASATVETGKGTFSATADATLANSNRRMHRFLPALAETRAKARALRDAVNIGVVSLEELLGENGDTAFSETGEETTPARGHGGPFPKKPGRKAVSPNGDAMTEAQRRYLFRLLAEQGITDEAAHDVLLDRLGIESLKDATKAGASSLIEELLAEQPA
jgi:hypothetical protein